MHDSAHIERRHCSNISISPHMLRSRIRIVNFFSTALSTKLSTTLYTTHFDFVQGIIPTHAYSATDPYKTISKSFCRDVAPRRSITQLLGIPSSSAMSFATRAFAFPSRGGALVYTKNECAPSCSTRSSFVFAFTVAETNILP